MQSSCAPFRPKRLLLEPRRFEGARRVQEHLQARDQAILDLVKLGGVGLDLHSASLASAPLQGDETDGAAEVANLFDSLRIVIPGADPGGDVLTQCLAAFPDGCITSDSEVSGD